MALYYLSPTGDDTTGTGAIGSPWKTPQKASNSAVAGSTIYLRAGTWTGADARLDCLAKDGLTFTNYAGEAAVLQMPASDTANSQLWVIHRTRNIVVEGNTTGSLTLGLTGSDASSLMQRKVINARDGGTGGWVGNPGFIVRNLIIDGCNGWGVLLENTIDAVIQGNEIMHCAAGIKLAAASGSTITGNDIHNMDKLVNNVSYGSAADGGANGIDINLGSSNNLISFNTIHDCHTASSQYGADGGPIEYYAAGTGNICEDNTIYDNNGVLETGTEAAGAVYNNEGLIFRRNIIYGRADYQSVYGTNAATTPMMLLRAAKNARISHNVFDVDNGMLTQSGLRFVQGGTYGGVITGIAIRNNIFRNRFATPTYNFQSLVLPTGTVISNNLVYHAASYSGYVLTKSGTDHALANLAAAQAETGQFAGDIWGSATYNAAADPLFVNVVARDYRLAAGSPAIDAGVVIAGVNDGYSGSAPDLGALETAAASSVNAVNGRGTLVATTPGSQRKAILNAVSLLDAVASVKVNIDKLPAGANSAANVFLRARDNDHYACWLAFQTNGTLILSIRRNVGATLTVLQTATVPGTVAVGTDYSILFEVAGTTLRAKAWLTSGAEPLTWQLSVTDTTAVLQAPGAVGLGARINSGTTNAPVAFSFDDFAVT